LAIRITSPNGAQRGNYRQDVFFSEQDRAVYLSLVASYAADFDLRLLGFTLMINHVHWQLGTGYAFTSSENFSALRRLYRAIGDRLRFEVSGTEH